MKNNNNMTANVINITTDHLNIFQEPKNHPFLQ